MNFAELNALKKEIENDLLITDENVSEKLLRSPNLFQKYLSIFTRESQLLKKLKNDLTEKEAQKFKYFKEDYTRQLNKGEIEYYVSMDEEYLTLKRKFLEQETICQFLEMTVQNFKSLPFSLRSYVDLRKFLGGN